MRAEAHCGSEHCTTHNGVDSVTCGREEKKNGNGIRTKVFTIKPTLRKGNFFFKEMVQGGMGQKI